MVDIRGLDKADVLCALYENARTQGMGVLHYLPGPLSREEAQEQLELSPRFDYLLGRVLKVDLSGDEFEERLYDRDNGAGAAYAAISMLRNNLSNKTWEKYTMTEERDDPYYPPQDPLWEPFEKFLHFHVGRPYNYNNQRDVWWTHWLAFKAGYDVATMKEDIEEQHYCEQCAKFGRQTVATSRLGNSWLCDDCNNMIGGG
jgi:hypothetical protein